MFKLFRSLLLVYNLFFHYAVGFHNIRILKVNRVSCSSDSDDSAGDVYNSLKDKPGLQEASSTFSLLSLKNFKIDNKSIAGLAASLASFLFFFQHSQPVSGIALLHAMAKDSTNFQTALCSGKPTVIDFYADWCESCKYMAPTMRQMEFNYKDKINFVVLDGTDPDNSELVSQFRVDGIPHLAFISAKAELQTALIGAIPPATLNSEMEALAKGLKLPYIGYDALEGESHDLKAINPSLCSSSL